MTLNAPSKIQYNFSTEVTNNSFSAAWTDSNTWYNAGSFVLCCGMLGITVVGLVGNLISAYIFAKENMRSSINVLLVGLAVSDALMLTLGTTCFFPGGWYNYFGANAKLMTAVSFITVYVYPVAMMAQTTSVWILMPITIERFLAVCYPFLARRICTPRNAMYSLGITYLISGAYNLPRFWEYKLKPVHEYDEVVILVKDLLRSDPLYLTVYMLWMYMIFMFAVPFAILVVLNLKIILKVRKADRERRKMTRQEIKDQNITIMMLIIMFVFLLSNSMAFSLTIVEIHLKSRSTQMEQYWFYFLTNLGNLMVEISAGANFFIYFLRNEKYRTALKQLVNHWLRREPQAVNCDFYDLVPMSGLSNSRAVSLNQFRSNSNSPDQFRSNSNSPDQHRQRSHTDSHRAVRARMESQPYLLVRKKLAACDSIKVV